MRHAILDLGTNTFHLLIVESAPDGSYQVLHQSKSVVKLGEGAIGRNHIAEQPFERGINAVAEFANQIKTFDVDQIHGYATSAVRSSDNGALFVKKIYETTGIHISVISGEEEAELIYYGIRQCVPLTDSPVLMMDIGGGSIEFVIGNKDSIFWKRSYNIGVARLLDVYQPSDPISHDQIQDIEDFLRRELAELPVALREYPVSCIIGSSGSFESYAEMISLWRTGKLPDLSSCSYTFDLKQYFELHQRLIVSSREERMSMKGLLKMRVDMIVLASIVTNYILHVYEFKEMKLSSYSLQEGALWKCLNS